jgi:hypothetical protein
MSCALLLQTAWLFEAKSGLAYELRFEELRLEGRIPGTRWR